MEEETEIAITRLSSRGQIVIPQEMRKGLKEGDKLLVIQRGNEIVLRKNIPESALFSEKSFAKTWLGKEEDDAWKDL